eukprot:PhM_4_TR5042/c0_g1_i1/m.76671/K12235/SRR; serine racemase
MSSSSSIHNNNSHQNDPSKAEVTIESIRAAKKRLEGRAKVTPVLTSSTLSALTPYKNLYFKCENFQETGAFKFRGATNAVLCTMARLGEDAKTKPINIVAYSSGNHGQAMCIACNAAGPNVKANIVMPLNAPDLKKDAIRRLGGNIVFCEVAKPGPTIQRLLQQLPNAVHLPSSDHADVISGQGTTGLELHEQLPDDVEIVVVPVGGGGHLSGVSTAIKALRPHVMVVGAEPEGADDAKRSLAAKKPLPHREGHPKTIADGLMSALYPKTFEMISKNVDKIVTVSDAEISRAMRLLLERMKVIVEPSAAVGFAVVLSGQLPPPKSASGSVAVVLTGGNVALEKIPALLDVGKDLPMPTPLPQKSKM